MSAGFAPLPTRVASRPERDLPRENCHENAADRVSILIPCPPRTSPTGATSLQVTAPVYDLAGSLPAILSNLDAGRAESPQDENLLATELADTGVCLRERDSLEGNVVDSRCHGRRQARRISRVCGSSAAHCRRTLSANTGAATPIASATSLTSMTFRSQPVHSVTLSGEAVLRSGKGGTLLPVFAGARSIAALWAL
jgi:hypothetical protein